MFIEKRLKIWFSLRVVFAVFLLMITVFTPIVSASENTQYATQSTDQVYVLMETNYGAMRIMLYRDLAPVTVQNFIDLVSIDFYDGLVFHRVIDDFVIQGGGFDETGEYKESPFGPIDLEIHPDARHIDGALGMARTNDPNSATSQFYICDGPQHFLDDNYAVFGVVINGIDVVRDIASVETTMKHGLDDWPVEEVVITDVMIVSQETWYVNDDNVEGPWMGSIDHPFQHIQDAVDHAFEHDNIVVYNGFYNEQIHITTPVHIIGQSKEQTIISSPGLDESIYIDDAPSTIIENISFVHDEDGALTSILVSGSDHCVIQHVDITSNVLLHTGISIDGSFNTIYDVSIQGNLLGTGVKVLSGQNNVISECLIESCNAGIYVFRSTENQVISNTVRNCSKAIYLEEGSLNQVLRNTLEENEQGLFCSYASENTIQQNNFIANIEQAKFVKFCQKGFLAPNNWKGNYWDDFHGLLIRPIFGLMYVPIGEPIGFFVPWYEFDIQPSQNPNSL